MTTTELDQVEYLKAKIARLEKELLAANARKLRNQQSRESWRRKAEALEQELIMRHGLTEKIFDTRAFSDHELICEISRRLRRTAEPKEASGDE